MSVVRSPVTSAVSAVAISVLGGGAVSIGAQLDNTLEAEAASGDFVAQPDLTDLTSIFQSDGSGNPSIGDSIDGATVLDTSHFGGKTAAEFIAGQTELLDNAGFSTSDDWIESTGTGTVTTGSGLLIVNRTGTFKMAYQAVSVKAGETYIYRAPFVRNSGSGAAAIVLRTGPDNTGTARLVLTQDAASGEIVGIYQATATETLYAELGVATTTAEVAYSPVSFKHLPGNHTVASGTGPTVAGANTTERGPELYTAGDQTLEGTGGGPATFNAPVITVEDGAVYELSGTISGDSTAHRVKASCVSSGATDLFQISSAGAWSREVTATSDELYLHFADQDSTDGNSSIHTNISVKKVIQLPVISTNGTDDKLTLPLPARRNLLTWTEDWSTNWSNQGTLTFDAASIAGPIEGAFASSITFGAQYANRRQGFTSSDGVTYTLSFWAKRVSGNTSLHLFHENSATANYSAFTITDEWVRYEVSFLGRSGGGLLSVGVQDRNASDHGEILVFGAQVEVASTATDYQRITSDHLADTSITMAVKTSDTQGMLVNSDNTIRWLGGFHDGSASTDTIGFGSGSPAMRIDGAAATPATRDALHTAISDGDWHVVTISAADLSAWTEVVLGYYDSASAWNSDTDYAFASVYPDSTATQALAEADAADAIKETGYALAA